MGPTHQWLLSRILTGLEKPKEHVGRRVETDVAGIVVYTFGGFAYASLSRLLVPNLSTLGRLDGRNASRVSRDLTLRDEGRPGIAEGCSRQHGGDLREACHDGKLVKEKKNQNSSNGLPR